jgi:hypothetical protein
VTTSLTFDTSDIYALLGELRGVEADLRRNANAELRQAAGEASRRLLPLLARSAAGSARGQAALVASSAKVKSDRIPAVQIGGSKKVGRRGTQAGVLLWGSEHGGRNFPGGGGSWIDPAVHAFEQSGAPEVYLAAVNRILSNHGVL